MSRMLFTQFPEVSGGIFTFKQRSRFFDMFDFSFHNTTNNYYPPSYLTFPTIIASEQTKPAQNEIFTNPKLGNQLYDNFNIIYGSKNRTYVRKIDNYLSCKNHQNNMIENILTTKTKIRIAKLFSERSESLHVSEVARILGISKSRTSECLRELSEKGILESRTIGRSVFYRLSSTQLAISISKALSHEKTILQGIEKGALSEIKKFKPVSFVLFGSALKGLKIGSDVDFILLYENKPDVGKIYESSSRLTEKFGFDVSIMSMSAVEFKTKARKGEEFALNVFASHKLLYGKKLESVVW